MVVFVGCVVYMEKSRMGRTGVGVRVSLYRPQQLRQIRRVLSLFCVCCPRNVVMSYVGAGMASERRIVANSMIRALLQSAASATVARSDQPIGSEWIYLILCSYSSSCFVLHCYHNEDDNYYNTNYVCSSSQPPFSFLL